MTYSLRTDMCFYPLGLYKQLLLATSYEEEPRSRCHCTPRPASLKKSRDLSQAAVGAADPCLAGTDVSIHPVALAVYLSHTPTNQALIPSGSRRYHVHSHLHAQ